MNITVSQCVPFVNTRTDAQIASQTYGDCEIARLTLHSFDDLSPRVPPACLRWLDAGVDGLAHASLADERLKAFVYQFPNVDDIRNPEFQRQPSRSIVRKFVRAVLSTCGDRTPGWISVPQLPYANDAKRNKINRMLAEESKAWMDTHRTGARFILPIILSHQQQTRSKTARNSKVQLASDCYHRSGADGYWVVDHTLNDVDGLQSFEKRVAGLIAFQEELATKVGHHVRLRVVGPYWGLGLVLWARNLTDYLGVGLGNAYTYYPPGGHKSQSKARVPLRHLYRLATASIELENWLTNAAARVSDKLIHAEFSNTANHMKSYLYGDTGRRQIANFHRQWCDAIASVSIAGRPLALYQQLSSAYVLGKPLDRLPAAESSRRPESVARLLMMHCL